MVQSLKSSRYIGIIIDSGLTLVKQVNAISKSRFYHIRNIDKVMQYITDDAFKILVKSSHNQHNRLDYGTTLLQGLPHTLID